MQKTVEQRVHFIRDLCARIIKLKPDLHPLGQPETVQKLYRGRFREAIDVVSKLISESDDCNFYRVLNKVAEMRKQIAYDLYQYPISAFGSKRILYGSLTPNLMTQLSDSKERVFKLVGNKENFSLPKNINDLFFENIDCYASLYGDTLYSNIDGESIPLTQYLIAHPRVVYWHLEYDFMHAFSREEEHYPCVSLVHTDPQHFEKILKLANTLFKKIKTDNLNEAQLFYTLGEKHWWVVQAMPWLRGSAAIMEIVALGVLKNKIGEGEWVTPPDIEAFCTPDVKEFAQNYANLWRRTMPAVPDLNSDIKALSKGAHR